MISKLDSKLPSGAGKKYSPWDETIRCNILFLLCYPSISSPPSKSRLHQWPMRSHRLRPTITTLTIQAISLTLSPTIHSPNANHTGSSQAPCLLWISRNFALTGPSAENTTDLPLSLISSRGLLKHDLLSEAFPDCPSYSCPFPPPGPCAGLFTVLLSCITLITMGHIMDFTCE